MYKFSACNYATELHYLVEEFIIVIIKTLFIYYFCLSSYCRFIKAL